MRLPVPVRPGPRLWVPALACLVALALAAAPAAARDVYVANSGSGTVSVFDASSGAALATVAIGGRPVDVAIAPDGRRAYVVDEVGDRVLGIDAATDAIVATVPVGKEPRGIAISPDGTRAYVTDFGEGALSVIDLSTGSQTGDPIAVGAEPEGVAVSPDGRYAYVALRSGGVARVDLGSGMVSSTLPDGFSPSRIALLPDGSKAFVTNAASDSISVFDLARGVPIGSGIPLSSPAEGIAMAPDGSRAFAASPETGSVAALDVGRLAVAGTLGSVPEASGVAIDPSGTNGFATEGGDSGVARFDPRSMSSLGTVGVGSEPQGIAVAPDQAPKASFFVSLPALAKRKLVFRAGASSDQDGKIVTYAWTWGDGHHVKSTGATMRHRYAKPGTYDVNLVVTDSEGCSTELVFTGQTVSCNGSGEASVTVPVEVLNPHLPGLHLAGGRRQRVRGVVNLFANCPLADCGLRARGTIVARFRRRGVLHRYTMHIGPMVMSAAARGWVRLPLKLPRGRRRAVLRALANGGTASVELTAIARDVHGLSRLRRRNVSLFRPPPHRIRAPR